MLDFHLKTRIFFGAGTFDKTGVLCKGLGSRAAVITTSRTLIENETIQKLQDSLQKEDIHTSIFDDVTPDPKAHEINNIAKKLQDKRIEFIIGIGGGSSIDAAKAVAALIGNDKEHIEEFMDPMSTVPPIHLKIVAIPTTAGTGSELSKGSIITDEKRKIKMGIRSDSIIPSIAIVDPCLTLSVPHRITKETGFDAFTHAFESYMGIKSNFFTEMISKEAIQIIYTNLPLLLDSLDNIDLRTRVMYASMIVGINLLFVGTCLPHRMQYPLGARYGISHGTGLAALYPFWLEKIRESSVDKLEGLKTVIPGCNNSDDLLQKVTLFIENLNLTECISSLKIQKEDIDDLRKSIIGDLMNDPAYYEGIVEDIYHELLSVGLKCKR